MAKQLPEAQLKIMRRLAAGDVLMRDALSGSYRWKVNNIACTSSARVLSKRGFITDSGAIGPHWEAKMRLTPTGIATLRSDQEDL
ncbi:hypothetical protein FP371_23150 [Citrobacter freundii]|uniref:hypothetical protein n=1 Tax=Gammaproteobacteria TaxID=1236 RepID=UPI0005CF9B0C|nr:MULTISPECIES: hypothetical protein [Gammaproteobacteria]EEA2350738.1 hypothetical protein [Salmonella enterica subsp. enterica serovar Enteritidis]EEC4304158.1 hypothetical protein [Salmonella enterica subsp. enterica serovar Enteritidis]EEN2406582.1 hypothetical protein [Salmonella enterica subsp. enterica serovar Enteritidis]EES8921628.1 hypothetical protein [Escherichia coli]EES9862946.1 hypothetical protein [Escherichia coli]